MNDRSEQPRMESLEKRLRFIEEIASIDPSRCDFRPTRGPDINFSSLTDAQRRYYAYYRTGLETGRFPKGDSGYQHLLVVEALSTEEGRIRLESYLSGSRGVGSPIRDETLLAHLRISMGKAPYRVGATPEGSSILLTELFLPGFKGIGQPTAEMLYDITLNRINYRMLTSKALSLLNMALAYAEGRMIEATGKGIGETFSKGKNSVRIRLFSGYLPDDECPEYLISFNDFDILAFRSFFSEIVDCCGSRSETRDPFFHESSRRGHPHLPEGCEEFIRSVEWKSLAARYPPDQFNGSVRAIMVTDGRADEDYPPPSAPSFRNDNADWFWRDGKTDRGKPLNQDILRDLDAIIGSEPSGPVLYRPVRLTEKGIDGAEYYVFWRDRFSQGKVYDYGSGCVMVRYLEMVRSGSGPEDIMAEMERMVTSSSQMVSPIPEILCEVAMKADMPMPRSFLEYKGYTANYALGRFLLGRRQPLTRGYFRKALGMTEFPSLVTDETEWRVFITTFALVVAHRRREDGDWLKEYRMTVRRAKLPCVAGECTVRERTFMYEAADTSNRFMEELTRLTELVSRYTYEAGVSGRRRKKELIVFGTDITPLMNRALDSLEDPEDEVIPELVMDRVLVSQAEEDLRYVIEAVGVDEAEEAPSVQETPEKKTSGGDPWCELVSSLSEEQRIYLEGCLEGTRPDPRKEDAVNALASDAVGDIILEDGKVFEEYIQQVRRALDGLSTGGQL